MALLFEFGERILILQSPMDAIRHDDPAWGKKEAQIDALGDNMPPGEAIAWINAGTTFVQVASAQQYIKAWDWACRIMFMLTSTTHPLNAGLSYPPSPGGLSATSLPSFLVETN